MSRAFVPARTAGHNRRLIGKSKEELPIFGTRTHFVRRGAAPRSASCRIILAHAEGRTSPDVHADPPAFVRFSTPQDGHDRGGRAAPGGQGGAGGTHQRNPRSRKGATHRWP